MNIIKHAHKLDIFSMIIVIVLYILNIYIKKHTSNLFIHYYMNDMLCPIAAMSFVNIMLSIHNLRITKLFHIIILMLLGGILWEYICINPIRVADNIDIICYEIGGFIYWLIYTITKHQEKKATSIP